MNLSCYKGKRVLLTGHTGFKGSWLWAWLHELGAEVFGLALAPESEQGLFVQAELAEWGDHFIGDIRDMDLVVKRVADIRPDIVFHLAAQPLVRESYEIPVETMATNVMGTVHVLEAVRRLGQPCAMVMITSDKCYENVERNYHYVESDPMGGYDPYSASKGAAELMIASYRRSFFPEEGAIAVASSRAGNVIGPGDWALDRIVPDAMRAFLKNETLIVRNPDAVRPWQHVLEPLGGYLLLGAKLMGAESVKYRQGWNFGPEDESARSVRDVANTMIQSWPGAKWESPPRTGEPHEAKLLQLDISKAKTELDWRPIWNFEQAVERTVEGYRTLYAAGKDRERARAFVAEEIGGYVGSMVRG